MILDRFKLTDKVAIVSGAGKGIGRGIAIGFAEAGADVVCAARTAADIEAVARDVRGLGRRAIAVPTDVMQTDQLEALIAAALDEFGRIDVLVNNAAYQMAQPGGIADITTEQFDRGADQSVRDVLTQHR